MKKGEDIKDSLIDKFYGEEYDKELLKNHSHEEEQKEMLQFQSKLENTKEKMDFISDIDFNMDISIMDIIGEAEEISNKKKSRWETVLFLLTSIILLSLLGGLTLVLGTRFIIYMQIAIVMLTPFILIPICKAVMAKGGKSL